jgi:hypothetical protein
MLVLYHMHTMVWSDDFAVGGIIGVYEIILYKTCRLLTAFEYRRGCDRMVVGFTTTYAINAYHRISIRARCTTLCDKVCQLLTTVRWFSPGHPVSSTNTTNRHNITEILLKVALSTIKQTKTYKYTYCIQCQQCESLYMY